MAAAERSSEHPLGQAIVVGATDRGVPVPEADSFDSSNGKGVLATVAGRAVLAGNRRLLADHAIDPAALEPLLDRLSGEFAERVEVEVGGGVVRGGDRPGGERVYHRGR